MASNEDPPRSRGATKRAKRRRKKNWRLLREDAEEWLIGFIRETAWHCSGFFYLGLWLAVFYASGRLWRAGYSLFNAEPDAVVLRVLQFLSSASFLLKAGGRLTVDAMGVFTDVRSAVLGKLRRGQ